MKKIETNKAPGAIGPYSQGMIACKLVFTSGQIPLDPVTGAIVGDTIEEQSEQVLKNLQAVLEAGGCDQDHLLPLRYGQLCRFQRCIRKVFQGRLPRAFLRSGEDTAQKRIGRSGGHCRKPLIRIPFSPFWNPIWGLGSHEVTTHLEWMARCVVIFSAGRQKTGDGERPSFPLLVPTILKQCFWKNDKLIAGGRTVLIS